MASEVVESGSESSASQQQQGATRSPLVQQLLDASENLPKFLNDVLNTQAVMVAGTEAAGFLVEPAAGGLSLRLVSHVRSDNSSAEIRAAAVVEFQKLLKPCLVQNKDGAIEIQSGDNAVEPQFCLVTLLRNEGDILAVTAVITRCRNLERAQQRLMSMQLVAGYFELYTLRRTSEQAKMIAESHQNVLQLATAVATAEGFVSAAMNLCNELATRTGATRVAVGWMRRHEVRLRALSHTEEFDKKQQRVKQLEGVMEECVDQEEPVHYDPDGVSGTSNVSRCAQALSRGEGGAVILSLPLRNRADVLGAVTMEFPPGFKLSKQAATGLAVAVDLLAPQLHDRHENDRWLITKVGLSCRDLGAKVIGPQYMLGKSLFVAAVIVVWVLFGGWPFGLSPMYHVAAPFQFDSIDRRKLQAPIDSYIKSVNVRPGDHITKGEVLLTMDTFELNQKLIGARAEWARDDADYKKYLGSDDPTKNADAQIALAQRNEQDADIKLYQDEIDRATVRAPFDGIVLKGDLTDQLQASKKTGDDLLEVAADNSLRAELSVAERDIQQVRVGQTGLLATTSLPTQRFGFTVDRIVPLGQAKEGDNVFTVYATLDHVEPTWHPGLAGEARINVEHRTLAWIWTHRFIEFIRLKLWF